MRRELFRPEGLGAVGHRWWRWAAIPFTCLLLAVHTGCSTNPATGQMQLNVLSEQEEIALGSDAAPQFLASYGGEVKSPEVREYVTTLGQRLAAESERPHLPWEFFVVDSEVVNAFALPGGKVFVTRGLLERMDNESQLAGVLGHEIGHVTAQHINQRMAVQAGVQITAAVLVVAGEATDEDWLTVLGAGTAVGGGLYALHFSRNQESQSDELGVRYMTRLGYNPVGMVQVMQVLKDAAGGSSESYNIFATHPDPELRIERLEALIQTQYPDALNTGNYRFAHDSFHQNVLQPFASLSQPQHTVEQARQQISALQQMHEEHVLACEHCGDHHHHHGHDHDHAHDEHPHGGDSVLMAE